MKKLKVILMFSFIILIIMSLFKINVLAENMRVPTYEKIYSPNNNHKKELNTKDNENIFNTQEDVEKKHIDIFEENGLWSPDPYVVVWKGRIIKYSLTCEWEKPENKDKKPKIKITVNEIKTKGDVYNGESYVSIKVINYSTKSKNILGANDEVSFYIDNFARIETIKFSIICEYIPNKKCNLKVEQQYILNVKNDRPTIENNLSQNNFVKYDNTYYTNTRLYVRGEDDDKLRHIYVNNVAQKEKAGDSDILNINKKRDTNQYIDSLIHNKYYEIYYDDNYGFKSNVLRYKYIEKNDEKIFFTNIKTKEENTLYANDNVEISSLCNIFSYFVIKKEAGNKEEIKTQSYSINEDGVYRIYQVNKLNQKSEKEYTLIIKRTPLNISIYDGFNNEITDGSILRGAFTYKINESISYIKNLTIKKNGEKISSEMPNQTLYYIENGNLNEYTLNREELLQTLINSEKKEHFKIMSNYLPSPDDQIYQEDISYFIEDSIYYIYRDILYARLESVMKSITDYANSLIKTTDKKVFAEEGKYLIEIEDKFGKTTKKNITIIKGILKFHVVKEKNNLDNLDDLKLHIYNNYVAFLINLDEGDNKYFYKFSIKKDGKYEEIESILEDDIKNYYTLGGNVKIFLLKNKKDGKYLIECKDLSGTIFSKIIVIDTKKPKVNQYKEYTSKNQIVSFADENIDKIKYIKPNGESSFVLGSKINVTQDLEGIWKIWAEDKAGNISDEIKVVVDTKKPIVQKHEKYINKETVIKFSDINIDKVYYKIGDEIRSVEGDKITINIEKDCLWEVFAIDKAGNKSLVSKIIVDTTPPKINSAIEIDNKLFIKDLTLINFSDINGLKSIKYTFIDNITHKTHEVFLESVKKYFLIKNHPEEENNKKERVIDIEITDIVGNIAKYQIIEYSFKPQITINEDDKEYINNLENISFKTKEKYKIGFNDLKLIQTKKVEENKLIDSNSFIFSKNDFNDAQYMFNINNLSLSNGVYNIFAIDKLGNKKEISFTFFKTDEEYINNFNNIKDSFKLLKTVKVNLPKRIFKEEAGIYTFKSLFLAQEFVVEKEIKTRVFDRGSDYMYISLANESVAKVYKDKNELLNVVKYYAYSYIEEIAYYENGNNNYYNIMNDNKNLDPSALTYNNIKIINNLKAYRIKKDFKFEKAQNILNVPYRIRFKYFNEGINEFEESFEINIDNNISNEFKRLKKMQGLYAVYEEDIANIKEKPSYYIYYDNNSPYIKADVKIGENEIVNQTFDNSFILENSNSQGQNILRYVSYKITLLDDLEDNKMVVIKLNGGGFKNKVYSADEIKNIPEFNFENGHYGTIKITLYDRNYNTLEYQIVIAGEKPKCIISDPEDISVNLSLRFKITDNNNELTDISIYKYILDPLNFNNQIKKKLSKDDLNHNIDITRTYYEFSFGGKYQIEYRDLFGRKYIEDDFFFIKDLPYAKLLGVKNKGLTNRSVDIIHDKKYQSYLYKIINNEKLFLNDNEYNKQIDDKNSKIYTTIFSKENITENTYLILLIDKEDPTRYNEYEFSIDAVMCEFSLEDKNKNKLDINSQNNTPFKIICNEYGSKIDVQKKGSLFYQYKKGDYINEDGLYSITITDRVGNQKEFIMILDQTVLYKLNGKYIEYENEYWTNQSLDIELLEPITLKGDAKLIKGGLYRVSKEGRHSLELVDLNNNKVVINIVVNLTPPKYTLKGVQNGKKTKENVILNLNNQTDKIDIRRNGEKILFDDNTIKEEGKYEIVISDITGNKSIISFEIDKKVNYTSNIIINNQYATGDININLKEEGFLEIIFNDKTIKYDKDSFIKNGKYRVKLVDKLGNKEEISFEKIDSLKREYNLKMHNNILIEAIYLNGVLINKKDLHLVESGNYKIKLKDKVSNNSYNLNLTVDNTKPKMKIVPIKNGVRIDKNHNKSKVIYKLYKNNKEIEYKNNIKEKGNYHLVATDSLGNIFEYDFIVKHKLSKTGILLILILSIVFTAIIGYIVYKRIKIKIY